jgi:preprotein translocase subunit YajC
MEQSEEILKAIESANSGMWFPIATIVGVFGILVMLLLYIWKQSQRTNDKRHKDNEQMISELKDNTKLLSDLVIKIETRQEFQQKEIDNILK